MSKYQVIEKIMNSKKLTESQKVYYIQCFLLNWYTEEDIKWLWEED